MKRYIKAAIVNILDEDADVQLELASDPNTDKYTLAELAHSNDIYVLRDVLKNPNTSSDTIDDVVDNIIDGNADHSGRTIMTTLGCAASNPSANDNTLIKLSEFVMKHLHSEPWNLYGPLLENPNTPPEALSILINKDTHNAHSVTDAIIMHPNVTLDVLKKLLVVDAGYCHYMEAIADRHHLPDEFLWEFARNGCDADKRNIANIDYAPSEILEYLIKTCSNIQYGYIASDAISNPNLSVDALYQLADDTKNLAAIVENPNCPSDILTRAASFYISTDNTWNLEFVASHPNTPVDVMYDIFEYGKNYNSPHFLVGLASNPNIPTELARQLLLKDDRVKEALAKNNVNLEILTSLVKGKVDVRKALAKNPNTPAKTLLKLAKDRSDSVVYAVADNPNLPEEIFVFMMEKYGSPWWLKRQLKRFPQYADRFN